MKRDEKVSPTSRPPVSDGAEAENPERVQEGTGSSDEGEGGSDPRPSGWGRSATSAATRPQMRTDLRFVHEDTSTDDQARRLPGRLRIIDLRSGRQFDFTAREHFLCRGANGQSTPEELRAHLQTMTDTPLSEAEVSKFFRRLHILGLLEPEVKAAVPAKTVRMRPRLSRGQVPGPTEPAAEVEPPAAAPPEAAPQVTDALGKGIDEAEIVEAEEVPETPYKPRRHTFSRQKPPASDPLDSESADLDDLFGLGADEPETPFGGGRMRAGMGGMMGGKGGGMMGGMGGGGMMGGMGGGGMMGGMGGGMGGGGMGGGGMGGGGMGGGMGGMMGGMGGGMMGGMMGGRGMGAGQDAPPKPKGPATLSLFNPDKLLRLIYISFWPLKFLLWTILPIVAFAGLTMIQKLPQVAQDLAALMDSSSLLIKILVGLVLVNFGSRIAQGVAIVAHGGKVNDLGINLILGITPRFFVDTESIDRLDRSGQMWAHGAPLLARLMFFSGGILVWAMTREQGGSLPIVALTVAKFGLLTFTMTAWPLFPADGMRWMGAAMGEPKLMAKAFMAAKHSLTKGRLPPMIKPSEVLPLTLYGLSVLITTVFLMFAAAILVLVVLSGSMGGLGVIVFLGIMTSATLWLMAFFRMTKSRVGGMGGGRGGMMGRMPMTAEGPMRAPGAEPATAPGTGPEARPAPGATAKPGAARPPAAPAADRALPNRARVVWMLILAAGLLTAFLPYRYEAGGEVTILPLERGISVARTDGEIVEVLVGPGEAVIKGQTLARLSSWDQESAISITEAKLMGSRAQLTMLENGAQPEQLEVERAQVASAEATLAYKEAEVIRARELLATATVSAAALEKAEADYATAVASLEVARANLALLESGATEDELAIAKADVEKLERELAFEKDELARTVIVAPIEGDVVTLDLDLRLGDYLRTGDALLEIESNSTVAATIAVAEADIGLIQPGQTVRLRARGDSETEVNGKVLSISPISEDVGYGQTVRVTAEFPNPTGLLRSEMTGWAKIDGTEMLVWEAYLRTITRFFQIDVWSWIP